MMTLIMVILKQIIKKESQMAKEIIIKRSAVSVMMIQLMTVIHLAVINVKSYSKKRRRIRTQMTRILQMIQIQMIPFWISGVIDLLN